MPRPEQMNINVATWGRLLKKNINMSKSVVHEQGGHESTGRKSLTKIFHISETLFIKKESYFSYSFFLRSFITKIAKYFPKKI